MNTLLFAFSLNITLGDLFSRASSVFTLQLCFIKRHSDKQENQHPFLLCLLVLACPHNGSNVTRSVDTQCFYSNHQRFIIWTGKTTQELSTLPLFNCRIYSYSFGSKGLLSAPLHTIASANWRKSVQNPESDTQQNVALIPSIHAVMTL